MDIKIIFGVLLAFSFAQDGECFLPFFAVEKLWNVGSEIVEKGSFQEGIKSAVQKEIQDKTQMVQSVYDSVARKTLERFNPFLYPSHATCLDGILEVMPENVKSAVRQKVEAMRSDNNRYDSNMDSLWSLQDEIFQRVIRERAAKVRNDQSRLQQRVQMGMSNAFKYLPEEVQLDLIEIVRNDIEESVAHLKKFVTKNESHMLLTRFMNYNYLGVSEKANECTVKLIFKSQTDCIKDFKREFDIVAEELKKLDDATRFKIPKNVEDIRDEGERRRAIHTAITRFKELLQEGAVNKVYEKFNNLIEEVMKVPGFLSTLFADELSKDGGLCKV